MEERDILESPDPWTASMRSMAWAIPALVLLFWNPSFARDDPGGALPRKLQTQTSLMWEGIALRPGLERLSETHRMAIFLDRRVDPGQKITFSADAISLNALLHQLAEQQHLSVSSIGPVVYMGPPHAARVLKTLSAVFHDHPEAYPRSLREKMERELPSDWPVLTVPRDWITEWVTARGIPVIGLDRVPHDLWPAGRLPSMPLADQLTLLLIGFDLKFCLAADHGVLELVPITGKETVTRTYRLQAARHLSIRKIRQQIPEAAISQDGTTLRVRGRVEDHERIAAAIHGPGMVPNERQLPKDPQPEQIRYSFRVDEKPIGPVLKQLAARLDLEIEFDETAIRDAGISLMQRISFTVDQVTLEDLLDSVVAPVGLACELEGKKLRIGPAPAGRK